jgi:hypothetical protein
MPARAMEIGWKNVALLRLCERHRFHQRLEDLG